MIQVDSISVQDSVALDDTLICKFYGIIGPNLCYQFSHFESKINTERIEFKLWGEKTGDDNCATAISYLNGKAFKTELYSKGMYFLNVIQPDSSVLRDSVFIYQVTVK